MGLELYPLFKELVLRSSDPLVEAVKLCIAGNSLDAAPPKGAADGGINREVSQACDKFAARRGIERKSAQGSEDRLPRGQLWRDCLRQASDRAHSGDL